MLLFRGCSDLNVSDPSPLEMTLLQHSLSSQREAELFSPCYHNQVVWYKMWLRSESIMFLAMRGNCYYQEENAGSNSVGFSPLEL